ncbi:MAG: hypothetical protein DWI58_10460 [Chloroflexi bacterium]|nr:MAG: hypothetical protein DWI58_10460 [Chloroflexota bacterium]
MGVTTIAGLIVAAVGILGGYMIEGGSIASLINIPGFMIVVVGTLGATLISAPMSTMKAIPQGFIRSLKGSSGVAGHVMAERLVVMADKARREGLLSLEEEAQNVGDPFAKKGLMLMIDGTDPETVKSILEIEIDGAAERQKEQIEVFKTGSGFSPTLGVLGAVLGLIHVLSALGGDVGALGKGIATAFVATFYGVGLANIILLHAASASSSQTTTRTWRAPSPPWPALPKAAWVTVGEPISLIPRGIGEAAPTLTLCLHFPSGTLIR